MPVEYEVAQIGDGWSGTTDTVGRIRQLVDDSLLDPKVVQTARAITRNVRERDKDGEIRAISDFIRTKIRYVHEGVETLQTPRLMLDEIEKHGKASGDCDEFVTLWMSLLRALGHNVRVRVISQRPDKLGNHIFGEVWSPGQKRWVADDTIAKMKPMGWSVPQKQVTNQKVYQMSGLSGLGHCGNGCGGKPMINDWIQVGRTPVMTSTQLSGQGCRRTKMSSRSLAPRRFNLKQQGMLFVNPNGTVSGLGQFDAIFSAITPLLSKGIEAAGSVLGTKITTQAQEKIASLSIPKTLPSLTPAAPAPTAPTGGMLGGINPIMLLIPLGLGLLLFLKK